MTPLLGGVCPLSPSHLALEVRRLLLPARIDIDHLHDMGAPKALLLHLLGGQDVTQGDGTATLVGTHTQGVSATSLPPPLCPGTPLPLHWGSC